MESDKIEQMNKISEMSEFNNFSEAKKNYIAFKSIGDEHFEGLHHAITDYVSELEQENAEFRNIIAIMIKAFKENGFPESAQRIEKLLLEKGL